MFQYARALGLGACCLHNDSVVETLPGKRPLTFAVLGSRAYFYTGRVARALANRRPHDYEKLRREVQNTTTPDAAEWLALPDLAEGLPPRGNNGARRTR